MRYEVIRIYKNNCSDECIWRSVPAVSIDNYPWDENGYKPKTSVQIFYTETDIHIKFVSEDSNLKAIYKNPNETVCKDTCVEFFFNPNPNSDSRYINFETNAIGNYRIAIGSGRENRRLLQVNPDIFKIKTTVTEDNISNYKGENWSVEYTVPFSFIEIYYGKLDYKNRHTLKGNFYKCGDETRYPHFGSWNQIKTSYPDFHKPEYFGDIILV
ncbi:carbohydrate-binding family 9-like protein [Clostridium swellfunianum]|uniref:carbohydrate-binding family 9-like protein n=1 Tax=Clostridium swellfunianum TaxID=1367462 RepID=UPI00202FC4E9|nr:carbohydrate-binding family 9-like protein [Clostridium swellfunianum]MCM0650888.1 carbohydrate-binding family 9-like protein [Clostridium swellfunianum]